MAGGKKTANRDLAAVALATGKTAAEAATAANVSERTIQNWRRESAFTAMVADLRGQMVARACGELADAMTEAAKALRGLLGSPTEGIQLRAASEILSQGLKVMELAELRGKLEELERRLEGGAKQ
ncbi:hypothetical protein VT84_05125 [Gemmata sp. SH-PL17]|uniref:helix-turn-helix domain-containing protein n=1 Tax=Gemmata sp. SH-PL17 TaxID=1630693 RepID=UPI000697A9E7|nr:helix-turn-helix domain-containing protein [Gemmata sp. SH-PL17]AMV23772.1 hypothetical protein VT84_05125 [Gemmata sp. SH-PL17]